jgi:hypothetical protein
VSRSFSERSIEVSRNFLQTAVIIDDRFHFKSNAEPKHLPVTPGRKKHTIVNVESKKPGTEGTLDAPGIIKSFAKHGIICGTLRFQEFQNDEDAFIKTAQRADIAIVDWEMEEEKTGQHALGLISRLLENDLKSPQRFRLISIYTGAEDLSSISETTLAYLKDNHSAIFSCSERGLNLHYQSVTIRIFAKDKHGLPNHFLSSVVGIHELPEKLIHCFSESVAGILPNTALASLSALRDNSHKLLGQFSRRLDAAYLSHKVMSNPPDDAEHQLVSLLISNIAGILEEHDVANEAGYSAIEGWIDDQCKNGVQYRKKLKIKKDNKHAKEQLLKLLKKGLANASLHKGNRTFYEKISKIKHERSKTVLSEITACFSTIPESPEELDRDLAYMMACKSSFTGAEPSLESGSILRGIGDGTYFICIQPACDCLRIRAKGRNFIFLPMLQNNSAFDISIPLKGNIPLNLKFDCKAYSVCTYHFKPNKASQPIIAKYIDGKWLFSNTSSSPIQFEWITTLNKELVLRLAHNFGKNISRVGTTESEWQRRWAK